MPSESNVQVEVLPHRRVGEQVRLPDGTAMSRYLAWAASLVTVCTWRGQLIAMPLCVGIYLRPREDRMRQPEDRRTGRLRYLTEGGMAGLHFPGDPLDKVGEFHADTCMALGIEGFVAFASIAALLASHPEPACDLDESGAPLAQEPA